MFGNPSSLYKQIGQVGRQLEVVALSAQLPLRRTGSSPSSTGRRQLHDAQPPTVSATASAESTSTADQLVPPLYVDTIMSASNSYVKHLMKLRVNQKHRYKTGRALVIGAKILEELFDPKLYVGGRHDGYHPTVKVIFEDMVSNGVAGVPAEKIVKCHPNIIKKVTGLESIESVQAVAEVTLPPPANFASRQWLQTPMKRLLVLEGVKDPANLGTLFRNALALGWGGVFLLPGCCDPFNDKVMKVARGALFRLPVQAGPIEALMHVVQAQGMQLMGTVAGPPGANGQPDFRLADVSNFPKHAAMFQQSFDNSRIALVLGSEGGGLSPRLQSICNSIHLPMLGGMESLNVGVAGGICMFMLSKGLPLTMSQVVEQIRPAGYLPPTSTNPMLPEEGAVDGEEQGKQAVGAV